MVTLTTDLHPSLGHIVMFPPYIIFSRRKQNVDRCAEALGEPGHHYRVLQRLPFSQRATMEEVTYILMASSRWERPLIETAKNIIINNKYLNGGF